MDRLIDESSATASFDPQDRPTYSPLKAPAGPMLLVLEKVEPYLDGFTVHLRVGNPTSANFSGMKGTVKWGRKYDSDKDEAHNKLSEKEIELSDAFPTGAWTIAKFNIAPAKADEVRRIVVTPTFSSLRLRGQ